MRPLDHAYKAGRTYLTPEDITAARKAGCPQEQIWEDTLRALSQRNVEDWSLCAFVALREDT